MDKHLTDILFILMQIEEKFSRFYKNISVLNENYSQKIKNAAKVLSFEEERHYEFYKKIIANMPEEENLLIDYELYKKAHTALSDFINLIQRPNLNESKDLINIAIQFENLNAEVLKNILVLFENTYPNQEMSIKDLFADLIKQELKHIKNLEYFLKA